ncbi:PQQ-binding-like beta-propeller repeat protein [Streptomyces sp. JV176]|uniref:serine/threonine-protein kinase n=1 Tax=Streptomyces sp. JV176 TaxID=858630 RepID=UPI002E75F971|nr:protein kinase [Streptomyces sp. JV176]MEE1801759.1 PQQ-binding-like beta-propeller repeat protein [Streptomyces sp. JV176]
MRPEPLLPDDPERFGTVRLLGRLGAGGMGRVYLGRTDGGRLVAVKTVHAHLAADPRFRERFRRETAAARAVTGAHTAAVLDADPESAVPWLATAYLPGITLRRAVAASGPLAVPVVRALGAALAEALTSIHGAGLVHRDLKPSNVMVTTDGPRVIDFGIARAVSGDGLTAAGDLVGTPGFIAPEQITGDGPVTAAADLFALGAVLTFAATGREPFGDGTAAILLYRAVHEEPELTRVPEALRGLVAACLRKDPARRPSVPAVLERTADPGAPLWWREEPLRSLLAEAGAAGTAGTPGTSITSGTSVTSVTEPAAPPRVRTAVLTPPGTVKATAPLPSPLAPPLPPSPAYAERLRQVGRLARRSALLVAGSGFAAVCVAAFLRDTDPDPGPADPPDKSAQLSLRKGSPAATSAPGGLRWTLTVDALLGDGADIDGLLVAGSTVVLHLARGPGATFGSVHARATADASPRWERSTGGAAPALWGVTGRTLLAGEVGMPAVDLLSGTAHGAVDDTLSARWFAVAGPALVLAYEPRTGEKAVRAVDARTGAALWSRDESPRPPAVLGDALLLAPALGSGARCLEGASGRARWTYAGLGDDDPAALAALPGAGRFALLATDGAGRGRLHLVDVRTGERAALGPRAYTVTPGTTALGHAGTTGLLFTSGRLHAFSATTGEPLWDRASLGLEAGWPARAGGARAPVTAGGLVLHWAGPGTLQALDPATGEEHWRRAVSGVARLPPAVAGGTVYAATGERCTALRLTTGEPLRTWEVRDIRGLAADGAGWYARTGKATVRAYNSP